jgi:SAM-dependent methyltransferase
MAETYESKLKQMEIWYDDLIAEENCEKLLEYDYEPHRTFLKSLRGDVLDVGGGAGLTARYLDKSVRYVVVDPSASWASPKWVEFARKFRSGGPEPEFVQARGEDLPFPDQGFDAVLSYWSLNHVEDAARCTSEMIRVLRPGGIARFVVEDVEPLWTDLFREGGARLWARLRSRDREGKIVKQLNDAARLKIRRDWPLQEDHFRISEADLFRWTRSRLRRTGRKWIGEHVAYDFMRT